MTGCAAAIDMGFIEETTSSKETKQGFSMLEGHKNNFRT